MLRKPILCVLMLFVCSCEYINPQSSGTQDSEALRQTLHEYNQTADDLATGLDELLIVSGQVNVLVEGDDHEALGEALQKQGDVIATLESDAARLQELDDELTRAVDGQPLGFTAAAVFAVTVAGLARYAKERFERANAAWEESGEHLANGDSAQYEESRQEVARNGLEVLDKTTSEVTNVLIKNPLTTPAVGLARLKERVQGTIKSDAKVLSATEECKSNPDSDDCKLAISRVEDDIAGIAMPSPSSAVLISPDMVPVDLGTLELAPHPEETEVEVDLMPIEEATAESLRDGGPSNNGSPNGSTNNAPNGSTNGSDGDSDGDGNPDSTDNCPDVANEYQIDSDGDGIGNECDETECPEEYTLDEDGCPPGESWDRDVVACTQDMCPTGAMYTYTKSCCCDCWDDKTLQNVHDPCRAGYLLFCAEAD